MQLSEQISGPQDNAVDYSIVRESDFYSELKVASETGQQSTFALILAMLTTDAKELDQFKQPRTPDVVNKSDLYKKYHIQQTQLRDELSSARSLSFNQSIHQNDRQSIQLDLALKPEALLPKSGSAIPQDVFNNLDVNARVRLKPKHYKNNEELVDSSVSEQQKGYEMDVEVWFNVLEEARTISMVG